MWWILLRALRNKGALKVFVILLSIMLSISIVILGLAVFALNQNQLAAFVVRQKVEQVANSIATGKNVKLKKQDAVALKYPELDQSESAAVNDGVPGNGLSLMLIDRISADGFVKDLLSLYRDSSQGKISATETNLTVTGLLGIHINESKFYDGGILPKTYLPYSNGKVQWGVPTGGASGDEMKLRQFNQVAANKAGINMYYNGLRGSGSSFTGPFQIDISYFGDFAPSSLNGSGVSAGRQSEPIYLPDALAYVNEQISSLVKVLKQKSTDLDTLAVMYSMWHNGGSGYMQYTGSFGVDPADTARLGGPGKFGEEFTKFSSVGAREVMKAKELYPSTYLKVSADDASAGAAIVLGEQGYYFSPLAAQIYTVGAYVRAYKGTIDRSDQFVRAWKALKGTTISKADAAKWIADRTKNIEDVYPSYASASEVNTVYGTRYKEDSKGALWKLDDATSPVYKHKMKGKDPRVLRVTNQEIIGHQYSTAFVGPAAYESMLKLAGVDVDKTNPENYYEAPKKDNEYVPESGDFSTILKKIGVTGLSKQRYDVLKAGYDVSGAWYVYGGYSKNKNGTWTLDCSALVNYAITTVMKINIPRTSREQYASNKFTTIGRNDMKPGDIIVRNGHVFFYLSEANPNQYLTSKETKTVAYKGVNNQVWALEAKKTGTRIGIHVREIYSTYIFRKLKAFND